MKNFTPAQLQEQYKKLPEDLKEAIFSVETEKIIQDISAKHSLQIDQMGELAAETGLVLLGLTKPEEYVNNLSEGLKINTDKAREIAKDINNEIFLKVKNSLISLHKLKEGEKNVFVPAPIKEQSLRRASPLELLKKHENEPAKKPEGDQFKSEIIYKPLYPEIKNNYTKQKKEIEPPPPPPPSKVWGVENIQPKIEENNMNNFKTEDKENIFRHTRKETTNIVLKDDNPKTEEYPKGDPYRESV